LLVVVVVGENKTRKTREATVLIIIVYCAYSTGATRNAPRTKPQDPTHQQTSVERIIIMSRENWKCSNANIREVEGEEVVL
jgi:transposase